MIESMHIENFKCFKSFDIELGKFNVLIGPNDSGKTAFLQAVRLLSLAKPQRIADSRLERECGFPLGESVIWRFDRRGEIRLATPASGPTGYDRVSLRSRDGKGWETSIIAGDNSTDSARKWLRENVSSSPAYHLEPRALRRPCALPEKAFQIVEDGEGLPGFLLGIAGDDPDRFKKLRKEFEGIFGYVPKAKPVGKKVSLFFDSPFGELPAEGVSDGVVLSLAFMALSSLPNPPKTLLIEEPENGVHYASLKRIVDTLRHLSADKDVQIIATTHSPYLLDLVQPEEVRVFSKDEEGAAHAAKLSDYPEVDKLRKHFMTGEIWTELGEAELVKPKEGVGT